jgi:osmotically-inducible protein OsmY
MEVEDYEIQRMITTALYQDPITDSYEYQAEVEDGKVKIYGVVDSWPELEHAGDVVKSIKGVCKVDNNINFVYTGEPRSDREIVADINQILYHDLHVDNDLIDVEVASGTVHLSGTVGSVSERNRAVSISHVAGVDAVIADDLEIAYWARNPRLRENNYKERTDEDIREAVMTTFLIDPRLKDFELSVSVDEGDVKLEGVVDNMLAKRIARENTENIVGVNHITNWIKVRPVSIPENEILKDKVETAFEFHSYLSRYDLGVVASNGKIYIDGRVKSRYEKDLLSRVASKVAVVEIENDVEVPEYVEFPHKYSYNPHIEPRVTGIGMKSDKHIKKDIESELWWSPFVNENEVNVSVNEGHVSLTGIVDTPLERTYAEINAREGGAITLENHLVIR